MSRVVFAVNRSTTEIIESHLSAVEHLFHPPLAGRVDIAAYAAKLFDKAMRFEAWDGNRLTGLVAAYVDTAARSFFITNVSTLPGYARCGIASSLMHQCIEALTGHATTSGFLKVHSSNRPALHLYQQFGFEALETHDGVLTMKRPIAASGASHEKP